MDYKFYSIVKKSQTVFFIKNSYPNFDYVNPNEYFSLLENADLTSNQSESNKNIYNNSYDTFVLVEISEELSEDSIKNGTSVLRYHVEVPENYYLTKILSSNIQSLNFYKNDDKQIFDYSISRTFNIKELSSSDNINVEYKYISLATILKYKKRININKTFLDKLINNDIIDSTKTITNIKTNIYMSSLAFIKIFGVKNDFIYNNELEIYNDHNTNIYLNVSRRLKHFQHTTDTIDNNSIYINKTVNLNNISFQHSNTMLYT